MGLSVEVSSLEASVENQRQRQIRDAADRIAQLMESRGCEFIFVDAVRDCAATVLREMASEPPQPVSTTTPNLSAIDVEAAATKVFERLLARDHIKRTMGVLGSIIISLEEYIQSLTETKPPAKGGAKFGSWVDDVEFRWLDGQSHAVAVILPDTAETPYADTARSALVNCFLIRTWSEPMTPHMLFALGDTRHTHEAIEAEIRGVLRDTFIVRRAAHA